MHKTGRVKRFNPEKGYGFIIPDGATQELFFHVTDLITGEVMPTEFTRVSFRPYQADRGPKALEVTILTPEGICPVCGGRREA